MKSYILPLLALVAVSVSVEAQHTVGRGGDPIRKLFRDARTEAVAKIKDVKWCGLSETTAPSTREWILNHQDQLMTDVQDSAHVWTVDPISTNTCAYTDSHPGDDVFLSYPTCIQGIRNMTDAIFTLIHESTHHLGISDEREADAVATAILNAKSVESCGVPPVDLYSPNACKGSPMTFSDLVAKLSPGQSRYDFKVTLSQVHARTRHCNGATGCAAWTEITPSDVVALNANDIVVGHLSQFSVDTVWSEIDNFDKKTFRMATLAYPGKPAISVGPWGGRHSTATINGWELLSTPTRPFGYVEKMRSAKSSFTLQPGGVNAVLKVTGRCWHFHGHGSTKPDSAGTYSESEYVNYGTFE